MDSPESSSKIVASSSPSPANQESPFFSYLRTLSPIQPPKVAHIARGFSELNIPTPPPVFTSPRLNSQPDTKLLKRLRYPHLPNAEPSHGRGDKCNIYTEGSDVSGSPTTKLMVGLVPCSQKVCENKGSMLVQSGSPSGHVNEYLSEPVRVDGADSSVPAEFCLKEVNNVTETLQSGCINPKEATLKLDDQIRKDMETDVAVKMTPSEETDEDLQEKSLLLIKSNEQDGEGQSDLISEPNNEAALSDSSHELASGAHDYQKDFNKQSVEGGQNGEKGHKPQVLPEFVQTVNEPSGIISDASVENRMCNFEEAEQNKRGMRRRCLQFEAAEARRKSTSKSHCTLNSASTGPFSRPPVIGTGVGVLDSSSLELATSGRNHIVNSSQPMSTKVSLCPIRTPDANVSNVDGSIRKNTPRKGPLPAGIGLHLNSIVSSAAMGSSGASSMTTDDNDFPNALREKSPSLLKQHLLEESNGSSLLTVAPRKFSTVTGGEQREIRAILTEPSASRSEGDQREVQAIVTENSSNFQFPHEKADGAEELNQVSPKKKRKRTSYTTESEGCKRCNCRRSKCLKLYCECFAAGIYCAEPCACQGCFNKPEYEDTVLETRQHIESRNPLAFAPKVVRRVTGSPANSVEDNNRMTPSSARHKRGCNCKKSMCLKKYCECYQAGVGCSDGCRCEGCKNIFGVKEGYGEISEMVYNKADTENWEDLSDGKPVMDVRSNFALPEHCQPHNLTPVTPLFQHSNNGKDVSKSRLPAGRCLPSPESDTNILSHGKSPRSPRNSDTHDRQAKMGEGSLDIVFYDQEMEFSATGRVDQFSPRWDGLEDICNLTPLPHPPSRVTTVSSSSNNTDCTTVSRVQLQGSVRFSGSLRWRSSPITPMVQLGGNKLRPEPSDSGYDILEDDTPDILKDTHTPIKAVKASSPNQKRISPPHSRLSELRSSASLGLRNGRKFVLQSISSFPSLTPFSDPKDTSSDK